jgi:hypothetical protein
MTRRARGGGGFGVFPARAAALLAVVGGPWTLAVAARADGVDWAAAPASGSPGWITGPRSSGPGSIGALTGRDFAGVRFPSTVEPADVSLAARRATVWADGGGATRRVFLEGDVRVEIGVYAFTAVRAHVWIEDLGVDASGKATRQVAVFFDRVQDPGARAGFAQAGDRLLVTGIVSGEFALRADVVGKDKPAPGVVGSEGPGGFVAESEARLSRHLSAIVEERARPSGVTTARAEGAEGVPPLARSEFAGPLRPGESRPFEPGSSLTAGAFPPDIQASPLPPPARVEPIFAREGVITFAVGTRQQTPSDPALAGAAVPEEPIKLVRGETDNTVLLSGGVVVQYQDLRAGRTLELQAQRAVVFVKPGPIAEMSRFSVEDVRGLYLEGDVVATDGRYTIRGPRVYYDLQTNRAMMVDAVFWTHDQRLNLPIYVRAREIRQVAANQWSASKASVATSSFFDPVFSIGAGDVTITQREPGGGTARRSQVYVDAKNITLRSGNVPFFYWPRLRGSMDQTPLRDIRVENSNGSGTAFKSTWDLFGLLGQEQPENLRAEIMLDQFFDRGTALGASARWSDTRNQGQLFGYTLPDDYGRDKLATGLERDARQEFRGIIAGENRWDMTDQWSLFLEGGYASDENFIDAFFRPLAETGREFTNAAYLRGVDGSTAFTLLAKGALNDFTPNQYLLQSQGYTVDKLPEISYYRLNDDLIDSNPGLLTWASEYRFSRMALRFTGPTARELGFNNDLIAQRLLGLNADQSFYDFWRGRGLDEDAVMRWDTRQEFSATLDLAPFKVTPFIVGRFTGYDQQFDAFSPDAEEKNRLWYAGGARVSTEIVRVNNDVDNEFLDLHRTRHIIQPSVTVWSAGTNLKQEALPVYDANVESLAEGTAVRAGLLQTWQTKRGGPGRWRNVDVLTVNFDVTRVTSDVNSESPIGQFFDYRPEYSQLGNFFTGSAAWQATDIVGLTYRTVFDTDRGQQAMTAAGGTIQHTPEFSSYAEARYINDLDVTYVQFGCTYQLTRRYLFGATAVYDTDEAEFQRYDFTLRRKVPEAMLGLKIGYDNILDTVNFSAIFEPAAGTAVAADPRTTRLRNLTR